MSDLPTLSVMLLVEVTRNDDGGRNRVEHRENPDPDHQLLEFVRFSAALLNDTSDPEQRHESSQKEHGAYEQVDH